jgi:hypothetical protein
LRAIIVVKIVPDCIVYSDTLSSYNVLDVSGFKPYRINHSELFSDQKNHINGIETCVRIPKGREHGRKRLAYSLEEILQHLIVVLLGSHPEPPRENVSTIQRFHIKTAKSAQEAMRVLGKRSLVQQITVN